MKLIWILTPLLVANLSASITHKKSTVDTYGRIPLYFEVNQGQADSQVQFLSRGRGYTLFITPNEAILTLRVPVESKVTNEQPVARTGLKDLKSNLLFQTARVHLQLMGTNPRPQVTGLEELSGKVNYFIGSDPKNWHTGIPTFTKVQYKEVYPGVDLIYYGNQGKLEYDFVVAPGADPKVIRFRFESLHSPPEISSEGHLVLASEDVDLWLQRPLIYQKIGGDRYTIAGRYSLRKDNSVGFELGLYDSSKTLIIDPIFEYSTYLGGSSGDEGRAIAVDDAGNAYVTGERGLPPPPCCPIEGESSDVFVAKLDPTGSELIYLTLFGGTQCAADSPGCVLGISEVPWAITVDDVGNAYVTGHTQTGDFPMVNALQPAFSGGNSDAFVAKLDSTGSELIYSTYLGGSGNDVGLGIALDAAESVYLSGSSSSTDFPTTSAFQPQLSGENDGFVTKFNSAGSALIYSTYLGGSGGDSARAIAVDDAGNSYLSGRTDSTNFPLANALQPFGGGDEDAFVAKLNSTGAQLIYSTYLGGSDRDAGRAISVDAVGNAYVAGNTSSTDFPTANALQPVFGGALNDVFISKLNSSGSALIYSTYLGGIGEDQGNGIAVDGFGRAFVTGQISPSADFVVFDAFVAKLDSTGSSLVFLTELGSGLGNGIALDAAGNAYVTGGTSSPDFPTVNAVQPVLGGGTDAFVAKIIDKRTKIGAFRQGRWFLDFNGNGLWDGCTTDLCHIFGLSGDLPVSGDWNGAGATKIGVFRNGRWFLDFNGNGLWDGCTTDQCIAFGLTEDVPVTGDWDGSGTTKIGVFRDGEWFLDFDGNGQWDGCTIDSCLIFGSPGYTPMTGDWDESGTTRTGVFQDAIWELDSSGSGQFDDCTTVECIIFGLRGDLPVTGHW